MNWTGGGLSRTRHQKGSLSAKQKNYFAKARNARSPRSVTQSFTLGGWQPTIKVQRTPRSHDRPVGPSPSQRTLDEYENVQPLVQKLDSLKPRYTPSKRKRSPSQPFANPTICQEGKAQEPIIIGSSQSASSTSSPKSQAPRSPPRCRSPAVLTESDSIEARRLQLLGMKDWVGLLQPAREPVRMKFADPADRDMIGRRRKIAEVENHRSVRRRLLSGAAPPLMKQSIEAPAAQNPFYGIDDISVRIGSAVDRSARYTAEKSLGGSKERSSIFSDELLDTGAPELGQVPSSPVLAFQNSQSASLRSSDYGPGRFITPSTFVSSSSHQASPYFQRFVERPQSPSSPAIRLESMESHGRASGSEWELLTEKSPPKRRLVLDNAPFRGASTPENDRASYPSPYFPLQGSNISASFPRFSVSPEHLASRQTDIMPTHHDRRNDASNILSPHRVVSRSSMQSELIGRKPKNTEFDERGFWEENKSEVQIEPELLGDLVASPNSDGFDDAPERRAQSQNRTLLAERSVPGGSRITIPPVQEHTTTPRDEAQSQNEEKVAVEEKSNPFQLPPKPTDQDLSKALEDEEAIWRKFVFGDEDSNPEELEDVQSQNPYPVCTQPSLIAEVSTSPLKRNPHLINETFDDSSLYLSEAFPSDSQIQLSQTQEDRNLNDSSLNGEAATSSPQLMNPSLIPNASSSLSSDEPHRSPDRVPRITDPRTDQQPTDTTTTSNNPSPPTTNHTIQHTSPPPPPPPPTTKPKSTEKIIYKKPPRYIGEKSSDPAEPTRLGGRILRSGRRVNANATKGLKSTRGRGKKRQIGEEERMMGSDDIVDD